MYLFKMDNYERFCINYQEQMKIMMETYTSMNQVLLSRLQTTTHSESTTPMQTTTPPTTPLYTSSIFTFASPLTGTQPTNSATQPTNSATHIPFQEITDSIFDLLYGVQEQGMHPPTHQQIVNATEILTYGEIDSPHDTCPITLIPFQEDSTIMRINHCNHIFQPDALRRWLTRYNNCPICRHDITSISVPPLD